MSDPLQHLPAEVREFLASRDSLQRKQLRAAHPDLRARLADPATHTAILEWLASEAAWESGHAALAANCIEHIRVAIGEAERSAIRGFLVHPDPHVRLRAYEALLTSYFPDKDPEAMRVLLHTMLADADDTVRAQAARYVERANLGGELQEFLKSWLRAAPGHGWAGTESAELVQRLLAK